MKENNNAYAYISIVAIVAIVAVFVMFAGNTKETSQPIVLSGGDVVGDARHLPALLTQTTYDPSNPIQGTRGFNAWGDCGDVKEFDLGGGTFCYWCINGDILIHQECFRSVSTIN